MIHKLSRSRYERVAVEEAGEHDWSGANLATAEDERMALRQALVKAQRDASTLDDCHPAGPERMSIILDIRPGYR